MSSCNEKKSAGRIVGQLNRENAKLLSFVVIVGFVGYHGILHWRYYDPDSCSWFLSSEGYDGDEEWQPGCTFHRYTKNDATRCLRYLAFWGKNNQFAFIGDSHLEQLYEYFIDTLKSEDGMKIPYSTLDHAANYSYIDKKLRLSVMYIRSDDISETMVNQFRSWELAEEPPSVIVASTGLQLLKTRNTTGLILEEYKTNLTRLVQPIDLLTAHNTKVLWKLLDAVDGWKAKNDSSRMTNKNIDAYNRATIEALAHSSAKIWSVPPLVKIRANSSEEAYVSDFALIHSAQIIFNTFCNDQMDFSHGYQSTQPNLYTQVQLLVFLVFLLW